MFPVLFDYSSYHIIWRMFFRSFHSVQYPVNNDVSVNAFSSDSPMDRKEFEKESSMDYEESMDYDEDYYMEEEEEERRETARYSNKNSSTYFITCL